MPGIHADIVSEKPARGIVISGRGGDCTRAAFELAETFLEAVEKLGEVEVSLDLGLAQEKDRPLALGDLERRNRCLRTSHVNPIGRIAG
jgi:hypothetical protein